MDYSIVLVDRDGNVIATGKCNEQVLYANIIQHDGSLYVYKDCIGKQAYFGKALPIVGYSEIVKEA